MKHRVYSPSSPDAAERVDVQDRLRATLYLLKSALAAGHVRLPPQTATAVAAEVEDITRSLKSAVERPGCSWQSMFPPRWWEQRWQAAHHTECQWFPIVGNPHWGEGVTGQARYLMDYQHAALIVNTKRGHLFEGWFVGAATGRPLPQAPGARSLSDLARAFRPQPDLLEALKPVRDARARALIRRHTPDLEAATAWQYAGDPWTAASANERSFQVMQTLVPALMDEAEELKASIEVEFTPAGRGTRVTLIGTRNLTYRDANVFVQAQRLSLLLLAIAYGNEAATLAPSTMSYHDAEARLSERGLNDLADTSDVETSGDLTWEHVDAALERTMAKRRATPLAGGRDGLRAWFVAEKAMGIPAGKHLVVSSQQLDRADITFLAEAGQGVPRRMAIFLTSTMDGPAMRRMAETFAVPPALLACAAIGASGGSVVSVNDPDPRPFPSALRSTIRLLEAVGCPAQAAAHGDIALLFAPAMSITDPLVGVCYLGLRHAADVRSRS